MSNIEFVGVGFLVVSAYHLLPAVTAGEIPTRRPRRPLRRDDDPVKYRISFGVFLAAGAIGLGLLVAALLRRAGL